MITAYNKIKERSVEQQETLDLLYHALREGVTIEEDGRVQPVNALNKAEDAALVKVGGLAGLLELAAPETATKLEEEYGSDYHTRLCRVPRDSADGEKYVLGCIERVEGQRLHDILTEELGPGVPEPEKSASYIMTLNKQLDAEFTGTGWSERELRDRRHVKELEGKATLDEWIAAFEADSHGSCMVIEAQTSTTINTPIKPSHITHSEAQSLTAPYVSDFFAGCGGGIGGFMDVGFQPALTVDRGQAQRRALKKRYGLKPLKEWSAVLPRHLRGSFVVISGSPCPARRRVKTARLQGS